MTVLRNIEQKIEALFEGVFGRAFRTNVQPVELARKLAKEMDDHRMISVSRVDEPLPGLRLPSRRTLPVAPIANGDISSASTIELTSTQRP